MTKHKNSKSAFSLMELSIVIVIIGLLIIGVIGSKHIVKKARINSARALTSSSPINSIKDTELWLEVAIDDVAFGDNHGLSNDDNISTWNDRSANQDMSQITVVGDGPIYSNSINNIPAIRFGSSSDSNHLQIDDASFLNGTDYTIMVAEKRVEQNSDINYLLGGNDSEDVFGVGYFTAGGVVQTHGESVSSDNSANVEGLNSYSNKPRVLIFTHSEVEGNKIYVNGVLANEDFSANATNHLTGITTLNIGKNYNGEIGEVVIFSRALKQVEIIDVRDYLSHKYNAPNNSNILSSCSGTVTSTGCEQTCFAPTINGTTTSDVADGGSANFTCNATGYAGNTLSYSCSNGSLTPTPTAGDCADVGCDGANGYYLSGDECVQGCSVSTITGSSDSGLVVANGAVVSCDATGYDGSTIATCTSGSTITGSCTGCATGYNYNNSTCEQKCSLDLSSYGISDIVDIDSGASTYDCSNYGDNSYTGTIILTSACNNGGAVTVSSGTCSEPGVSCESLTDTESSSGGNNIHIFDTVGTHTLDCSSGSTGNAWILVIGGGGGGGHSHGGGGGAGEFIEFTSQELTATSYTITVGSGGNGGLYYGGGSPVAIRAANGGNSSLIGGSISITALGGGAGGSHLGSGNGSNGGSGGGAGVRDTNNGIAVSGSGSLDSNHFANDGGNNNSPVVGGGSYLACTGGGGGAGSAGGDCNCDTDNDGDCDNGGGDLATSAIFGGTPGDGKASSITGSSVIYAAGGAGGCRACTSRLIGGSGGIGGDAGFSGGYSANDDDSPSQIIYDTDGTNGDDNTGSGGGGGGGFSSSRGDGGNGGSGIVIISY